MAEVLVVADDLTGANATGARFARLGMRVGTVAPGQVAEVLDAYDVVVVNVDSRGLSAAAAAARVGSVVASAGPVSLVVKRTDTTLRGNVGAELEAAWRAVRARVPAATPVRALFVPAFPSSARVTADGHQLLDGVPLERTELAVDPLNPMTTSDVVAILRRQSSLGVRHVPLRHVTGPDLVDALATGEEPVVLCDALTEEHLADIARAAARTRRRNGTVWVSVDPGPGGALLAEASGLHTRGGSGAPGPLLAVVGSATAVTRRQLEAVTDTEPVRRVDVDAARFCADPGHRSEVADVLARALASARFPETVVVRTTTAATDVADLPERARRALPRLLAATVARSLGVVLADPGTADGEGTDRPAAGTGASTEPTDGTVPLRLGGLYTSGGEITTAVLDALGVRVFEVRGEVLPLAVHGVLDGGPMDGVPVVTKGGLVGDDSALRACLAQLRDTARERPLRVRTEMAEPTDPHQRPSTDEEQP
ncbi:four-carbon acid sugar kinase family protein [Nocardiopsis sp. MG754419]|uniref:four-carbon acid sugar kinase family protein n=1 Tax=Nocardiopsis sp. MG754419 TaxID=2259865 RepID=UPI001BA57D8C|nr:four-carbon acid sugar kinase family protein [Nocardiopsis sp. MG754419]MBR8743038.1 four-carbon acid sugar kinase family protein [Nocardiopsis sp. MG754419]